VDGREECSCLARATIEQSDVQRENPLARPDVADLQEAHCPKSLPASTYRDFSNGTSFGTTQLCCGMPFRNRSVASHYRAVPRLRPPSLSVCGRWHGSESCSFGTIVTLRCKSGVRPSESCQRVFGELPTLARVQTDSPSGRDASATSPLPS
jgi:hypothetical protein